MSGALLDVWQADDDGVYEFQMPEIDEARLRAKYHSHDDGAYCVHTIAPVGYGISMDCPVGSVISGTGSCLCARRTCTAHCTVTMTVPGPFTMSEQAQNDHNPDR